MHIAVMEIGMFSLPYCVKAISQIYEFNTVLLSRFWNNQT